MLISQLLKNLPLLVKRVSLCSLQIIASKLVFQCRYCYKICPCHCWAVGSNKYNWLSYTDRFTRSRFNPFRANSAFKSSTFITFWLSLDFNRWIWSTWLPATPANSPAFDRSNANSCSQWNAPWNPRGKIISYKEFAKTSLYQGVLLRALPDDLL